MNNDLPKKVTDEMMKNDAFSQWLGIQRIEDGAGTSVIGMKVRDEMLNGFSIMHGGIAFALADSALAFAANSHGIQCLSVENSIHYIKASKSGDQLTARAREVSRSNKIAVYHVDVSNQKNEMVAEFRGTVYRSGREWEV